jgi:hypothetical protein
METKPPAAVAARLPDMYAKPILGCELYNDDMVRVEERLDDYCLCLRLSHCREGAS